MTKRIGFRVYGRVQGVFFRKFTCEKARGLGITGRVQNDNDGTVSGEAQGSEDKLKQFVEHLKRGPTHAHVDKVEQSDLDIKDGESGFTQ